MSPVAGDGLPAGLQQRADRTLACWWGEGHDDYAAYHDSEWGVPVLDDVRLYEKMCLEGFQSGLSWLTILRKRENFRAAFRGFDFEQVARFGPGDVQRLLGDAGIVRHRGKIEATINNARAAIDTAEAHGSLAAFFWSFEPAPGSRPARVDHAAVAEMAKTTESAAMSRALKKLGWRFVGPTTCYALMQAAGIVNDHLDGCHRRPEIEEMRALVERGDLAQEAERVGERLQPVRRGRGPCGEAVARAARPWPERPVSAANKSGRHTLATQRAGTYPHMF